MKRWLEKNLCLWTRISKCEDRLSNCENRLGNCENRLGNCESKIENIKSNISILNTESIEQQQNGEKDEENDKKCWIMEKSVWEKTDGFIVLIIIFFLFWYFKVYDFFFSKKFSQDCYDFLNPFITKFSQCLFLAILTFILLCLIIFYFINRNKDIEKNADKIQTYKIGHDLTRLLSWLFSLNGFFFIIVCAIVALVFSFICNSYSMCCGQGKLELTALTLSITLATLIPAVISRIITTGEIEKITETKLNEKLERFNATLFAATKEKAHESRMSAVLLFKMVKLQQITPNKDNPEFLKMSVELTCWSIGWASKSIYQYLLVKDGYAKSNRYINELIKDYIIPSKEIIKKTRDELKNVGLDSKKKLKDLFRERDLESIIIMHSLMDYYRYYPEGSKETIKALEKIFYTQNPDIDFNKMNFDVIEMDTELNKKIKDIGKNIIEDIKA